MTKILLAILLSVEVAFGAAACRASPGAANSSAASRAKGVYVIVGPGPGTAETRQIAFSGPASGVYLRLNWSTIQPRADGYDWSGLDADLAAAKRGNKRVSISIRAGQSTPDWLTARVRTGQFTLPGRRGGAGACETIRVAAPWDRDYQAAYARMMKALAGHLRATGSYDLVTIVKVTGINVQTEEMRLPSSGAGRRARGNQDCAVTDATATWKSLGYRPSLIVDAWQALAGSVNQAFPDKLLAIHVTGDDFPPMDANGDIVRRGAPAKVDVRSQIVASGVRMFPGRFAVQRDSLNNRRVNPAIASARQTGAIIGMQSNLRRGRGGGGGAGCNLERGGPKHETQACTPETYRETLAMAKQVGAIYVELWPIDVGRFAPVVSEAQKAL